MDDILTRSRKLQQAYESGGGTEVKSPAYFVDAALLDYIENNHVGVRAENVVLDIDLQEMISVTFNGEPLEIKIGEIVGRVADKKHPKYFHNSEDARAYIDAFEGLNPRHQEFLEKSFTDVHAPNEPITRDIFGKIGDIISETVGYKSSFQKNADMKLLVEYMEGEFINPVRLKAVLERHNLDEDKNTVKQFLTAEGVEFDSGSGFPLF
tara:strand:- start:3363 stop:3989 length:627 start_codon:yes stop_codon:yes gene_type:complete